MIILQLHTPYQPHCPPIQTQPDLQTLRCPRMHLYKHPGLVIIIGIRTFRDGDPDFEVQYADALCSADMVGVEEGQEGEQLAEGIAALTFQYFTRCVLEGGLYERVEEC